MRKIAYGPLNLSREELGRLTYGEFLEQLEGWKWRERRHKEHLALLASWVTAPHVKKPISPDKFLGETEEEKKKKKTTPEKSNNLINELKQKLGVSN